MKGKMKVCPTPLSFSNLSSQSCMRIALASHDYTARLCLHTQKTKQNYKVGLVWGCTPLFSLLREQRPAGAM